MSLKTRKPRIVVDVSAELHAESLLTCRATERKLSDLVRDFLRVYNKRHAAERAAYLAKQAALHEDI
jgi:hypothetical protein